MKSWGRVKDRVDDPAVARKIAGWLIPVTLLAMPVTTITGLEDQNWYISKISEFAILLAVLSWWQSTRVEVHQAEDADVQDVVDKLEVIEREIGS